MLSSVSRLTGELQVQLSYCKKQSEPRHTCAPQLRHRLKETFADPGEILELEWRDVKGNILTIAHPVKGHLAGEHEISANLIAMLAVLPKLILEFSNDLCFFAGLFCANQKTSCS